MQHVSQILMSSQDEARPAFQTVSLQSGPGRCQSLFLYVHTQQEGILRRVLQQEEAVVTIAAGGVYQQERRRGLPGKTYRCHGPAQGRMG